ncbi:hypothetical protein HDU92_003499 [Lobulomyces angularis]|nr:hypothetical protein HDU92_003499 [Lobulomyces angularis]
MTRHAWKSYRKFAWGSDILRPVTKTGGSLAFGIQGIIPFTIIDAIDTLYVMGLNEEYLQAKNYISKLDESTFDVDISVNFFENVIRLLGGLISIYDLSGEKIFLKNAIILGDKLLKSFQTPFGLPHGNINLKSGMHHSGWKPNLAEIGSNSLEFTRLSKISNDPKYAIAIKKSYNTIQNVLGKDLPIPGLFPQFLNVENAKFDRDMVYSLGANADSFYEYLL